jgi:hypothetical protein
VGLRDLKAGTDAAAEHERLRVGPEEADVSALLEAIFPDIADLGDVGRLRRPAAALRTEV